MKHIIISVLCRWRHDESGILTNHNVPVLFILQWMLWGEFQCFSDWKFQYRRVTTRDAYLSHLKWFCSDSLYLGIDTGVDNRLTWVVRSARRPAPVDVTCYDWLGDSMMVSTIVVGPFWGNGIVVLLRKNGWILQQNQLLAPCLIVSWVNRTNCILLTIMPNDKVSGLDHITWMNFSCPIVREKHGSLFVFLQQVAGPFPPASTPADNHNQWYF